MKTTKYMFVISILISLISCNKNDYEKVNRTDVEKYVESLKSNSYDSLNLPAFTYTDIPALLQYRNETQIITKFPHNPISSFYGTECTLGVYILWTIESIRAVSINSEFLIERFPSQNSILAQRNSEELVLVSDQTSQDIAAKAYYDWWENNRLKNYNEFKNLDPLKGTAYKWH
jgi:hypothetical protein